MNELLASERDLPLIDESNEILALLNRPERVSVIDMRGVGRNRTWAASQPGSPVSFFFKVLVGTEEDCQKRWRRLTALDVTGSADADIPRPRCIGGLPERRAMVYQNLPGARSAAAVFAGDGLTLDTARRMGEVVAGVHRHQPEPSCPIAEAPLPTATDFYVQSIDQWSSYSAGQLEFWRLLHSDRELAATMAALRNARDQTAFVHGDLRLDQFMLLHQSEIYLCDWENAGWGDPSHDVAGVVGGWLYRAINRVRGRLDRTDPQWNTHGADLHSYAVDRIANELEATKPLISAFLDSYSRHGPPIVAERMWREAGWHVFDRVNAVASQTSRLGAVDRAAMGVARAACLDPGQLEHLFRTP
ncbi:phosphotransferase [Rhodococcoides corynebacterioides]|uniref:phosphotransferase n=1 Tax=Rhodococcoides corynebacterioides TaxID=53972 RepID=UPI001C9A61E8|nr:phosphotransferase [Rhodococcus corynebacterioides]MBY6352347.1 aminoglycoside phosphotransferase family protein [Rhodococcus corynebacterioides]MBY6364344.1 aminoglycoside phosphotransferase family protein [Rhodococcus corynebacterioides]